MMKYLYNIIFFILFMPSLVFANPSATKPKHEKSKTVNKEFSVASDAKVSIINRYGNITITTWDKNEVSIEVVITVKGDDLEDVMERLDEIDIEFDGNSNLVEAKTIIGKNRGNNWSWWGNNNRNKMSQKINYVVKMPKTNEVSLNNDYGNIYIDEIFGKANINCDYGKIQLGKLMADDNSINLDYCPSSTINFMKSGNINADYSKLTIEKSETIKANIDYTTLRIEETNDIDFNADYGGVTVNMANEVQGNSDYASIRLGSIAKRVNLDADYGSIILKELQVGFENVTINAQYASIRIEVDPKISFTFEMDLQYSGFKSNLDNMEYFKKVTKSTKKYYEGRYGSADKTGAIKIKSQYGGVSINE